MKKEYKVSFSPQQSVNLKYLEGGGLYTDGLRSSPVCFKEEEEARQRSVACMF